MAGPSTFILPSSPVDRRRLGKYDVLCRLSTGGMSEIHLARQQGVGGFTKLVVLKTILPDILGEEDFVRMFLDEARTTASFNHPNIAQVYELDVDDGQLFMAMEFVQGCTLVELARACRAAREPIPVGLTLAAVRDTALALHYAHTFTDARGRRQTVIHRDVAEKNIMVTYDGVTKLLDFGIAKAQGRSGRTSVGMVKGTSGYMSPEQVRGEPLDARSDVFSLGVVLHECLTGLRLFHGKTAEEGMMAALKADVAPPSRWNSVVTGEIDAVTLKALQKDRDARHGSALELARAIERAAPGAIWHPEQSGEAVSRFFADRRAETRRVVEDALGGETTGEVRVKSLIIKMKAGARASTGPEPTPAEGTGAVAPAPVFATQPGVAPHVPGEPELTRTSPGRPRALRSPGTIPPPQDPLAGQDRTASDFDDDSEAKTIPAAAPPDDIRELRRRFADPVPGEATVPPASPEVSADPYRPRSSPVPRASNPSRAPLPRTTSGETVSVTGREASSPARQVSQVTITPVQAGEATAESDQVMMDDGRARALLIAFSLISVVSFAVGLWALLR